MEKSYYVKRGQESLFKILKENAKRKGSEECYNFFCYENNEKSNITITRNELLERSINVARIMKNNNIQKGDNVIIFSTQTLDNVLSAFASVYCGVVFTIIPPPIDEGKKMRFISVLSSCKAKHILCNASIKNLMGDSIEGVNLINVEEDIAFNSIDFSPENIDYDDVIYLQYTSGSTSVPKGVEVTYGNLISDINLCYENYKAERMFSFLPFFHNMGLVYSLFAPGITLDFVSGIMSPKAFLEKPSRWIENLSEFKAEMTAIPHSIIESYSKIVPPNLLNNIDLSNLKSIHDGSEVVNYSGLINFAKAYEKFGMNVDKFITGYGLAETTCAISSGFCTYDNVLSIDFNEYQKGKLKIVNRGDKNSMDLVSGGKIIPETKVIIVNPETNMLTKENEFGEILVQGPIVAKGYYNNEEATNSTFKARIEGVEGEFVRTGDLGIVINNHVYITGRVKELIIINGNNILPNDIVVKLKEKIPCLDYGTLVPFSVQKDGKERLILLIEFKEEVLVNINKEELCNEINKVIYEYFEVSPYDIGILKEGEIVKADNGKVSIMKTRSKYIKSGILNKKEDIEDDFSGNETMNKLVVLIKENLDYKVRIKDNLLNIGMDSLAIVELSAIIEDNFKVSVPVSVIFEKPTIEFIGNYIDKSLKGEDLTNIFQDKSYMKDACKLDQFITFERYTEENPLMENVFVTGTTGFVGAYLVYNLMERSKAIVYCHVRAKDKPSGFNRIKENMQYYKLWKEDYEKRIVPVIGSVDKVNLGIEEEEYNILTKKIDTVYHNGAILNFIYPFNRLSDTNVFGTKESIAFASKGKNKFYNYVSSYSVFDNPAYFGKTILEDDELLAYSGYYLPYSETKWVSEKIIHLARKKGLRACIYRPGEITGDNKNGIWKYGDSVSRTVKDIFTNKKYADTDLNMHMTQVDYIASAMIEISKKGINYGKAYNLLNPEVIAYRSLGEMIKECGFETEKISYDNWKNNLFNSGNEHPLKLLESLFKIKKKPSEAIENRYGKFEAKLDCTNTINALKETDINCPLITVDLMKKYIKNFI